MAAKTKNRNGRTVKKKALNSRPALRAGGLGRPGSKPLARADAARRDRAAEDHDGFVFTLHRDREHISDAEMLRSLRAYAKVVGGRPFSQLEFNEWKGRRGFGFVIARRFLSWRKALAAAGIEGGRARSYEPHELIERLETAWRQAKRPPSLSMLKHHGKVTAGPFVRHWGSLARACELLVMYKRGKITLPQLLAPAQNGLRRPLPLGVRWEVLARDGHRCRSCGKPAAENGVRLEVDHIVPVSAGGSDEMSNLRALCWECNRGKGGKGQRPKRRAGRMTYAASTAA